MKKLFFLLPFLATFSFVSVHGDTAEPSKVVEDFFEALSQEQFELARESLKPDYHEYFATLENWSQEELRLFSNPTILGETKDSGEDAKMVTIEVQFENLEEKRRLSLEKHEAEWRISLGHGLSREPTHKAAEFFEAVAETNSDRVKQLLMPASQGFVEIIKNSPQEHLDKTREIYVTEEQILIEEGKTVAKLTLRHPAEEEAESLTLVLVEGHWLVDLGPVP